MAENPQDSFFGRVMGEIRTLNSGLYDLGETLVWAMLDRRVSWQRAFPVAGAVAALYLLKNPEIVDVTPMFVKKVIAKVVGGGLAEGVDNIAAAGAVMLGAAWLFKTACPPEVMADAQEKVGQRWGNRMGREVQPEPADTTPRPSVWK